MHGDRRWLLQSDVRRDGKLCARARSSGAWLDLDARKLAAPPESLLVALLSLDKTTDFEVLRGHSRGSRAQAA